MSPHPATDELLLLQAEAHRALRSILVGWIIAIISAFGSLIGFFATLPSAIETQSVLSLMGTCAIVPYVIWATYWGVPFAWKESEERFEHGVLAAIPVILLWGYLYGCMGGAIYQYIKRRRFLAKVRSLESSVSLQTPPPLPDMPANSNG